MSKSALTIGLPPMETLSKCNPYTFGKVLGTHPRRVAHNRCETSSGQNVRCVDLEREERKCTVGELFPRLVQLPTNAFERLQSFALCRR